MALTAARRSSDLHRLSLNSHRFSAEDVVFDYLTPPKQHRPGLEPTRPVTFAAFPVTPALYVVECFRKYLRRTADLRQASSVHLFLSTKRPHHPVTSATIARWIKQVMSKAGVDTSLFGAHSTRAASTSAAKRKGMSTVDIMKCADWSCASVSSSAFISSRGRVRPVALPHRHISSSASPCLCRSAASVGRARF